MIYLQNLNPPLFDTEAIRLFQVKFDDDVTESETEKTQSEQSQLHDNGTEPEPEEEANPAAASGAQ